MANTTKLTGNTIQIRFDGTDDWSIPGDLAGFIKSGLRVKSISFNPTANGDIMIVKAGLPSQLTEAAAIATTATAVELMHVECTATSDQRIKYFGGEFGQQMWPFIDASDCTGLTTTQEVTIELA